MKDQTAPRMLARLNWDGVLCVAVLETIQHATEHRRELTDQCVPNTGEESVVWFGPAADPYGFALFYEARPRVLWVDQIYVDPAYRRGGLASRMLAAIEEHAKAVGYEAVEMGIPFDNHASTNMAADRSYERTAWTVRLDLPRPEQPISRSGSANPGAVGDEIPF